MCFDDRRIHLESWADTILGDPDAKEYVSGIGVHGTRPSKTYAVRPLLWQNGSDAQKHPGVFIMGTEACEGFLPWSQGPRIGDFTRGETYAHDILGDLNNWAVGWTDWNAFLDLSGGPNWAKNVVDSPILLDTADTNVLQNPMVCPRALFSVYSPR